MELRDVLLFVHIAAAVAWLGGGLFAAIYGTRVVNGGTSAETASFISHLSWFGGRFFPPLSMVVLAAGIWMVADSPVYGFSDPWVSVGFGGIISTMIFGMGFLGPRAEKIKKLAEEHGPDHPDVRTQARALLMFARLDLLVLFVVVGVMVFKPGM